MDLEKIELLVRPLIEKTGFRLYDVEFVGRVLRICIDKEGGVNVSDCVEATKLLNPILDEQEDLVPGGQYELEVGSPGLDRKLRKPEHFSGALGETIHVATQLPLKEWNPGDESLEKRRNIKGVLKGFDGTNIILSAEGGREVTIPLNAVTKASVDFEIKTTPKKGKRN